MMSACKHHIIKFEANPHHLSSSLLGYVCGKCGEKIYRRVDTWFFRENDNLCPLCGHRAVFEMKCKKVVSRSHIVIDELPKDEAEAFYNEMQERLDEEVKLYAKKGHQWSGWPGAMCLKCHQPDMQERALADGWIDITQNTDDVSWRSSAHKNYVAHCNGSCPADMSFEERDKYAGEIERLRKEIEDEKN